MNFWVGLALLTIGFGLIVTMWPLAVIVYLAIKVNARQVKLDQPSVEDFWISAELKKEYYQLKKKIVKCQQGYSELSAGYSELKKNLPSASLRSDGYYDERSRDGKVGNKALEAMFEAQKTMSLVNEHIKDLKADLNKIRLYPTKIRNAWCDTQIEYLTVYQTFFAMILVFSTIPPLVAISYGANIEYSFLGWLYNLSFRTNSFFEWSDVSTLSITQNTSFEEAKSIFLNGGFKQWLAFVITPPMVTCIFYILRKKYNKTLILESTISPPIVNDNNIDQYTQNNNKLEKWLG